MPDFSHENNCFQHFNFSATGRNDVNLYLLSHLVRLSYPERLGTDLGTNRYVPDSLFQEKFTERTLHWFYDQSSEPKPPRFNRATWNALRNVCNNSALSQLEWRLLEDLFYEVTGETADNPPSNPVIPVDTILRVNAISEAATNIRSNRTFFTAEDSTYTISEFDPRSSPILVHGLNRNVIFKKATQIEILANKLKSRASTPNCMNAVNAFLSAIENYRDDVDTYQNEKSLFNARLPQIAYITNASPLRVIDDPECIMISTNDYLIIVIRGTDGDHLRNDGVRRGDGSVNLSEWIFTNFLLDLRPGTAIKRLGKVLAPGRKIPGKVHTGMYRSLLSIDRKIVEFIRKFNGQNKKIWITGHSLGAAQAALLASILINHDKIPVHSVYTFGSPNVGDDSFTRMLNAMFNSVPNKARLQRFELRFDPITCLPMNWKGYRTFGIRNWFSDQASSNGGLQYFFNRQERTFVFDNHLVQSASNKCDHSPDKYCIQVWKLLQRNNNLKPNFPREVPDPGTNTSYC